MRHLQGIYLVYTFVASQVRYPTRSKRKRPPPVRGGLRCNTCLQQALRVGFWSTLIQKYMANHVNGTSTRISVPPTCLGELRQHVLLPLIGNPLFNAAEQLRANHFVHESDDIARLTRWGANVLAEIARRQAAVARHRRDLATRATLCQLSSASFRGHRSHPPQSIPSWVPGTFFPDRSDRWAGTFDRFAAASFQPADSLTLATLLNRQSR